MKKSNITLSLLLLLACSGSSTFAQYSRHYHGLNQSINMNRNNPIDEVVFSADTTINHIDFGQKKNNRAFVILFPFKRIENNQFTFEFKPSQITETRMSRHSLVKKIELTNQGFEITYVPSEEESGPVDDFVGIRTENGDIILRLTGEIIDHKKKEQ